VLREASDWQYFSGQKIFVCRWDAFPSGSVSEGDVSIKFLKLSLRDPVLHIIIACFQVFEMSGGVYSAEEFSAAPEERSPLRPQLPM